MKKVLFSLIILFASLIGGSVSAYYNNNEPYLYVEKIGDGGYASGRDGIQSFTSAQDIILTIGGNNINDDVNVQVYDADMEDVLKYLVYRGEGEQINTDVSTDDNDLIATMDVNLEDEFTLPVDGNGIWLVHTQAGDTEVYMYVIRSRYGTVVKEEQDGLLAWVQDIDTKKSLSDVPMTIYSLRDEVKKRTQTKTDSEGIAHTDTSAQYDVMIVGESGEEALVPLNLEYLNIEYKSDDNKYQGQKERAKNFIFTDRPLYKPGDTVYFKVISRIDDDLVYRTTDGKWKVQLVTGWGDSLEVIAQDSYEIDSYGAISGEMQLPEDIKTGQYYRLEISSDKYENDSFYGWFDNNYSVDIQVEHYRKPAYELGVAIDEHEYINGENISFEVNGKYFSGESLANAQVEYTVSASNFWEPIYENNLNQGVENYQYGYEYGTEVLKGSVVLDANGHADVSVPTNIIDGKSKVYTITVEYAAQTDEPVIDQENVLVYAGEYGIYRKDYQHSFTANKEAVIGLALHENEEGINVGNQKLEVLGKRIWYEVRDINARHLQYDRKESTITPATITTDSTGKADFRFTPRETGSYELNVRSTDKMDNMVKKDFQIWVSDKERFVPEQGRGLDIVLDKNEYEPESNVAVAIASKTEDRDVLMDIERDFVHRFEVLHIDGNTKNININLEDTDTPNMIISVNSFADDRLDTAQKEIKISAKSKKLDIDISTDKNVYAPGDTVTVDVITKDQGGNPQSSDVALWAVDKALFELVPQNNHDIYGAYWNHRPGYTNETNSLRGIWVQMAEGGGCFLPETQVLMDDGETKNIEDVHEGEHILTFDENGNNLVQAQVIKTHSAVVDGYLTINNTLRVTDNHIVWVNNTWKRAGDIRIGDRMRDTNGQEVIVGDISWQAGRQQVYNLIVENVHTYIADGYYVHNGKGGGMRTLFKDVAYWNPRIRTGDSGTAQVSFKLPDDLTTWVISAIGATKETIVGDATSEIHTTKAAIIRPQMPNILRKGDEAVVVASAHNNTSKDREFIATLELSKGEINNAKQKINIPAGESRVVMWSVSPEYADESIGFTYTLTATDDEKINDSVYKEVPIEQFGFWQSDSVAHTGVEPYNAKINSDARNDKTTVELTVASTVMSSLSGAMNYLIHYPYGCMEQTTSAFMPAVLAKENPKFFAEALEGKDIDDIINTGIARLIDKQNPDGGWSWWGGNSDLFLSTYVAEYLKRANLIGYEVDSKVFNLAQGYFNRQISRDGTQLFVNQDGEESVGKMSLDRQIMAVYGRSVFDNSDLPELRVPLTLDPDLVAMAVIAIVRNGYTYKGTNGYDVLVSQIQIHVNATY